MRKSGITLIESLIAMLILAFVMTGAFYLLSTTISITQKNEKRIIATYLAQECTELTRNLRDTAWKKYLPWDTAFSGSGNFTIESNILGGGSVFEGNSFAINFSPISGDPATQSKLYLDGLRYNHTSGNETPFYRYVSLSTIDPSTKRATCTVGWEDEEVSIVSEITNWYQ